MASKEFLLKIPNQYSTDSNWIEWHTALKKRFGVKEANALFNTAWQKYGGTDVRGNTNQLRNYLKKYGIELETGILSDMRDMSGSIWGGFSSMFTVMKWIGVIIGGMVLVFIGMVLYNVGKNPVESANTAMQIRTGGLGKLK